MSWLSQHHLPLLWNWFQWAIGGTVDKRRLCLRYYAGQRSVLEVGCSVGNIATAFLNRSAERYVGLDIDPAAIALARKRLARFEKFAFYCQDLTEFAERGERFGYVLIAGVLHHVPDQECAALLQAASALLEDTGVLVVVEPVLAKPQDPALLRFYLRYLEQGRHVRDHATLERLVKSAGRLVLTAADSCFVGATPLGIPRCARFGVWRLEKGPASTCL